MTLDFKLFHIVYAGIIIGAVCVYCYYRGVNIKMNDR